jgi:hypothetical protein
VAEIISEWWAELSRNRGRHHSGIMGDITRNRQRVARTPHYDGVIANAKEPAVIALFGIAPVDLNLVDPTKPAWRRV